MNVIDEKKCSIFSPEIPESWLSKHSPGYFESRFCEKEQMRQSRDVLLIRLTRLPKLHVEAFKTNKQI